MTQNEELLPRIARFALVRHLATSMAAERSLEDFRGAAANEALLECVKAWRYGTLLPAANSLLERAPHLLEQGLLAIGERRERNRWYGILLGRVGNTDAVPLLCRAVKQVSMIDHEMFDMIEHLAQPEHREMIEGLAEQVRDGQRERAESVTAAVLQRWADNDR